ncbi:MAG: dihydroneopterin aldolase [Alcaligenaceae bacterium]|nr:dihydroneopterin aldolase [Alcaligenaceae bacterium]
MSTRRIFFSKLALDARIGILAHELRATQPLHINAEIDINSPKQLNDNDINSVLDYRKLREAIIEESTRGHVHLVESLGEMIANRLLQDFPEVQKVMLRISKPQAFADCEEVGIEVVAGRES